MSSRFHVVVAHDHLRFCAAHFIACFRDGLQTAIAGRGPLEIEVSVAEAPGQVAHCRESL